MTANSFMGKVIKSGLLYPKKLVFQSEDIHFSCMQETILAGRKESKGWSGNHKRAGAKGSKQRKKRKGSDVRIKPSQALRMDKERLKFRNQSTEANSHPANLGRMEFFNRERNSQKHIVLDINYYIGMSKDNKTEMFLDYSELLNY